MHMIDVEIADVSMIFYITII